ncbi:MAG: hypothetical protein RQ751_02265 [Longimicrobiales bacterium]|nr:hypothetical protein [Longimicrobiales bacterium]
MALLLLAGGLLAPAPARAQGGMEPPITPDPSVPVKPGFDVDRAILSSGPNFIAQRDPEFQPLADVLRSGAIEPATPIVTFEAGGRTLTLVTAQLAYHHVAQGEMAGEPWMVTF